MTKNELVQVSAYFKLMAEVENGVGDFYALCRKYWPEEEIWGNLALEEKRHGETVLAMLAVMEKSPEKFALLKPLVLKPLTLFLEGLRANEARVRSGAYRKLNAMAVSRDIENSLIESRYDKLVETRDQEYNVALGGLLEDTRRHGANFASRLATLGIVK